jgi:hypothetical protein
MRVGDDPVGRDREAAAMAEARHLALLEDDDDDPDDAAPGGADIVRPRRRGERDEGEQQDQQMAHSRPRQCRGRSMGTCG